MHCPGCSCPRGAGPTRSDQQGGFASTPANVSVEQIDYEIQRLSLAIKALQHRRNNLAPVSRLVPDVLCHIFEFLAPNRLSWDEPPDDLSWMSFSRVSRHWRDIALAHPPLWTFIPTTSRPDIVQEFLHRSQAAPLQLVVPYPDREVQDEDKDEDSSDSIRLAFGGLGRADSLRYTVYWEQGAKLLNSYQSTHAPILERVTIMSHYPNSVPLRWMSPRCTPRLKELEIIGLKLSWPLALPSLLTRLHLSQHSANVRQTSAAQLRATLENLPNLEDLSLCGVLPKEQPLAAGESVGALISLHKLAKLDIVDPGTFCAAFLQKVALPDLCILTVYCAFDEIIDEVSCGILFDAAMERYHRCREHRRPLGLLSCVQVTRRGRTSDMQIQETWVGQSLRDVGEPISYMGGAQRWELALRMEPEVLFAYWKRMFGSFVREGVQRLEITGNAPWDERVIPVPMHGVNTIYSEGQSSVALLRSLHRNKVLKDSPVEDHFPVLRTLILKYVRFNEHDSAQSLLDTLRIGSSGIHQVVLQSCVNVPPELFEIPDVEVVEDWTKEMEDA